MATDIYMTCKKQKATMMIASRQAGGFRMIADNDEIKNFIEMHYEDGIVISTETTCEHEDCNYFQQP